MRLARSLALALLAATPALAMDPAGLDIVGVKIGMTAEEVRAAITSADPAYTIEERRQITIRNGAETLVLIVAFIPGTVEDNELNQPRASNIDHVEVLFTGVPDDNRVAAIGRHVLYPIPTKRQTPPVMMEAIKAKYGTPFLMDQPQNMVWAWAPDGTPLPQDPWNPSSPCDSGARIPAQSWNAKADLPEQFSMKCGVQLHVKLGTDYSGLDRVLGMRQSLVHSAMMVEAIQELDRRSDAVLEAERRAVEDAARALNPPRL